MAKPKRFAVEKTAATFQRSSVVRFSGAFAAFNH